MKIFYHTDVSFIIPHLFPEIKIPLSSCIKIRPSSKSSTPKSQLCMIPHQKKDKLEKNQQGELYLPAECSVSILCEKPTQFSAVIFIQLVILDRLSIFQPYHMIAA